MVHSDEFFNAAILIVDDQDANVQLLERVLREAGYLNLSTTRDPRQVCTLHRERRFDLILLDLLMPDMDGFEVMEGLEAINPEGWLPVIVLTAQPAHKLRALQAGARDFVNKPFDLSEVKTRIRNLLEVQLLYRRLEYANQELEQIVLDRTADLRESEARFRALTALATDWFWEQNETGHVTHASGPVQEVLGMGFTAFLSAGNDPSGTSWNEADRQALQARITDRQAFVDFPFSRVNAAGVRQHFLISGEPMFDADGGYTGYRGIGVETAAPAGQTWPAGTGDLRQPPQEPAEPHSPRPAG